LTNTGGGLYTFAAGTATFQNPTTGATYTNVSDFTLNPSSVLTIPIQAVVQGSAGTSAPGTITTILASMGVTTCTNAASVVGTDPQSDDDLKSECKAKLGAQSVRGPRGAYRYAVQSAL